VQFVLPVEVPELHEDPNHVKDPKLVEVPKLVELPKLAVIPQLGFNLAALAALARVEANHLVVHLMKPHLDLLYQLLHRFSLAHMDPQVEQVYRRFHYR